ncbi:hypothetical protein [Mesorhizobium sp. YR577]|uniref:hypothetical protein n=1 Tax=Mesorhizobium sp. YR577 TaxID=1884373 RepID=UPI0008F357AE|nr:hypothetical protein [Mesorhizobium sp. YR577]SFT99774.1 antitoxin VapB [Mesorhizobium sp. YR577]
MKEKFRTSQTEPAIATPTPEIECENGRLPLAERLATIAGNLKAGSGEGGRQMSKDEIDQMWGHT